MARPRKSEHIRDALIEAGIEHLLTTGYHGTGIKQILDQVKVPKGSFYNYFPSKEAFVAELINTYSEQMTEKLASFIANSPDSAVEKIRSAHLFMLQEFAADACRQGCLIGNIAAEIGGSSQVCQQAMKEALNRWQDKFAELITSAQIDGSIRKDLSAEAITKFFWATWEGSLLQAKMEGHTEAAEKNLSLLLDQLLKPE